MPRVKVIGAGSIGNHLTHACRSAGWEVTLCDIDPEALRRAREAIYPARYGAWDPEIVTCTPAAPRGQAFDITIVGTPPDTHLAIALDELADSPPRVMMIEKPLCPPDLGDCDRLVAAARAAGTRVTVGYNHTLTAHTQQAEQWLREQDIGRPLGLHATTLEHWGGILKAHPWLAGPGQTYLGHLSRGGGALGEHSHSINIWQHFAHFTGQGRIVEVTATLDMVEENDAHYDRTAALLVRAEGGLTGTIVQDVITDPAQKTLRLIGSNGQLFWQVSVDAGHDAISTSLAGEPLAERLLPKSRPDDFAPEARHLGELLDHPELPSPIDLDRGLDTMLVIAAAIKSSHEGRRVTIDHGAGYNLDALR